MNIIGITGGVGAGKSKILDYFKKTYDAEVIEADQVAKELEEPGAPGYEALVALFGRSILSLDGSIDRDVFADRIFGNEQALSQVNAIIHPMTWERMQVMIKRSTKDLVVIEAALFNQASKTICDELWFIDASKETRIQRLMEGRGYSLKKCEQIMARQPSREDFLAIADYVIDNNQDMEAVRRQIEGRYP